MPLLGGASGFFSLRFGKQVMNAINFKKLQKAYNSSTYDEQAIRAEIYNQMKEKTL